MATKEKKSFKKYAKKHLATVIENRRKGAKVKKEKIERSEKKKQREAQEAQREELEHQEQLNRLKDTDPEFYSYLEEEDPTLLQFGKEDINVVEDDEGSDAETEVDDGDEYNGLVDDNNDGGNNKAGAFNQQRITREELDCLIESKNVEACIDIFVSAARELGYKVKENFRGSATRKFEEPSFVKESMISVARFIGANLSTVITGRGSFKSHKIRFLMRRMLLALVASISEGGGVDAVLTAALLHAMTSFVPVLHYIKGITKAALKAALLLCCASEESVRIAAFVVVRTIATRATGTRSMYQSVAFKGIFLTLVRTAHNYNIHNAELVAFLMNCVVDIYGTDMEAAYQHTFVYLRQLAIYLRAALQQQTQNNVRAVVNWQYLNALRTWGAVVSKYSEPAQLGPLIHPVVQISIGLMDLFSSPRMFPLHLKIIEVLNHISIHADGVFIPVAPYILRILTFPGVALNQHLKTQWDKDELVDLQFTIRVKKSQARNSIYHQGVWYECLYLLTEHLATHSHSLGFPEAFWAVEATLKRLRGEVKVPKIHSQLSTLLRHIQTTTQRIIARRDQADGGPCDLLMVKQLEDELKEAGSPLTTYHQALRQQRLEAFATKKEKLVANGRNTLESFLVSRRGSGQKIARGAENKNKKRF